MKGKWHYLYHAINKRGETQTSISSPKFNNDAAYQFLERCLRYYKKDRQPKILNTDKYASYAYAIAYLKKEVKLRKDINHRQIKYLNNGIKYDHAPIKKLINTGRGFLVQERAWSIIQGYESLRMLSKGDFDIWLRRDERKTFVRKRSTFINLPFNVGTVFT